MQFASGVTSADLNFTRVGSDLQVAIAGTVDKLIVQNWYTGTQYRTEQFKLADGTIVGTPLPASAALKSTALLVTEEDRVMSESASANLLIEAMTSFGAQSAEIGGVPVGWMPSRHFIMTGDIAVQV